MRDVIAEIKTWREAGKPIAIATNVKRQGMSLRPLGAKMAVTTEMEIAGSVTGGCLEGAVYDEAQKVITTREPKLLHYGVSGDQKPWDIGLTCGSSLDIFIESLDSPAWKSLLPAVLTCMDNSELFAIATVISGAGLGNKMMLWPNGQVKGSLGNDKLNQDVFIWAKDQLTDQETTWSEFLVDDQKVEVFLDVLIPDSRLIIIGAGHIAIPLVKLGKAMGYHTIVIDPREAFANRERFPDVDELVVEWPSTALKKMVLNESCYVAVISHDEKLDNPALAVALAHNTRYVGVLGTRKNIPQRLSTLKEMGVKEEQLNKLHAPIGLPMGAILPEEIALSILSEMVSTRHGVSQN
jgi:xanthine dehydrogenase accessory factor